MAEINGTGLRGLLFSTFNHLFSRVGHVVDASDLKIARTMLYEDDGVSTENFVASKKEFHLHAD